MKAFILPEAKQKLDLYVDATTDEISGLGKVIVRNKKLYIEDIYLLKQESGGSSTELDQESVAEFMTEMMARNEPLESLKLWWHSHGTMGVFWSGTDEDTARKFGNGWMMSLVVNRKGEYKSRLDVYEPVDLVVDNIELDVALRFNEELRERIKAEVAEKVSKKGFVTVGGNGYMGYGGYRDGCGFHPGIDSRDNIDTDKNGYMSGWEKDASGIWRKVQIPLKGDTNTVSSNGGNGNNGVVGKGLTELEKSRKELEEDEDMMMNGWGFVG